LLQHKLILTPIANINIAQLNENCTVCQNLKCPKFNVAMILLYGIYKEEKKRQPFWVKKIVDPQSASSKNLRGDEINNNNRISKNVIRRQGYLQGEVAFDKE
jgi:hypothetical protein